VSFSRITSLSRGNLFTLPARFPDVLEPSIKNYDKSNQPTDLLAEL
jgi:hypothetical protein